MFRYYLNKVYLPSMNSILDKEEVRVLRRKALAPAAGKVLEIGFGSGLNAGHYPVAVQHWTAVDAHKFPPRQG